MRRRAGRLLDPGALSARAILLVVAPALAGWLTVFQLRGWGQVQESGALGYVVIALGGVVLAGLVAVTNGRLTAIRSRSWTAAALVALILGVAVGSVAFDAFASLGGLEVEVAVPSDTVRLGEDAEIELVVRNSSEQTFADVTLAGELVPSCLPGPDVIGTEAALGTMGPGEEQRWSCVVIASAALNESYVVADGQATDDGLVDDAAAAGLVDADLVGAAATFTSRPPPAPEVGSPVAIILAGEPATLAWEIENVGDHVVPNEYVVDTGFDPSGDATELPCDGSGPIAAGATGSVACEITLAASDVVRLVSADDTPLDAGGVTVAAVAPDDDPDEGDKPLAIDRSVETYPGSGQWGAESFFGSTNVLIQVTNGPEASLGVVVEDPAPDCSRSLGDLDPLELVEYTCVAPVRSDLSAAGSGPQTVEAVVTATGADERRDVDTTTSSLGGPPPFGELPQTDGGDVTLIDALTATIDRYFNQIMFLLAAIGALLLAFDQAVGPGGAANRPDADP